jgi:hypothetical protein
MPVVQRVTCLLLFWLPPSEWPAALSSRATPAIEGKAYVKPMYSTPYFCLVRDSNSSA